MHQEVSNVNNSTINQIIINNGDTRQVLEAILKQMPNANTQITCDNSEKLNKLYQEFGIIVNSFDSMFYISTEDREKLKSCIEKMKVFEDDYVNESKEGIVYYNNLFVLMFRYDMSMFAKKYEQSPDYAKNNINNKYLYSAALFELGRKKEAYKTIDEIILVCDDDKYRIQKGYYLFIDKNVLELKKLIGTIQTKNDMLGYYGVFELEVYYSKNKSIKYLKKLNRKYKNKPLYHLRMAEMIYEIDNSKDHEIRENIKNAFINIDDTNLILIMKLIDTSINVKQEEYLLKLLCGKKYDSLLVESMILNILVYKSSQTDEELIRIKEIMKELEKTSLANLENVNAVLSLNSHKELEAIDFFNESYSKSKSEYAARNLLNLILKNNDTRNMERIPEYIDTLSESKNANDHALISSGYMLLNNSELAMRHAYIATILSQNNRDYYMRFWAVHTKFDFDNKELKIVDNDCIIEISNSEKVIKVCMDKSIPHKYNISNFHGVIFNDNKKFEQLVIGRCVGEKIFYDGKNYTIKSINNKYDYLLKLIFPEINDGTYFKAITSDDSEDPLKGIKKFLIEEKNRMDKKFDTYDLEKTDGNGLPLSFFVNNEDRTYRDILLHLLFSDDNSKLYAGEINELKDMNSVLDITSLVMLEQFDMLNRLIPFKSNIYVTQSTINTINKTFNYYLNNKKESLTICVDDNGELRKQELKEEDYKKLQEFWRNVLNVSSEFNIVNHESSIDKRNLESCQIDTIDYSIDNKYTLVSEDLILKKIAYVENNKVINSTNFLAIAGVVCTNPEEYINLINTLSKGKYVYCINEITLLKMLLYSFVNNNTQKTLLEIIDNIFSTSFLYFTYIEIVIRVLLYIHYYEEISDEQFYIRLIDKVKDYCDKYENKKVADLLEAIKKEMID